jgi:asparagine synthase (glutamine-hydrolysing)
MCGINAIIGFDALGPADVDTVGRMNAAVIHRGPEDEGMYVDSSVVMGMRRLKIIDIEGGHQPILNEDQSVVLIFNGEIYNYVELRDSLIRKGHTFRTNSDSEVIVHQYEEMGLDCLNQFRGIFAFVLWDKKKQELLLARDHFGIKPLYVSFGQSKVYVSSELQAILRVRNLKPTLDAKRLWDYLVYGYAIDQKFTVVKEVERLMPGEYMIVGREFMQRRRYWKPWQESNGDSPTRVEETFEALRESIRLQMRSDVPLAVLLSGGVDSSAIASIAKHLGYEIDSITIGYEGDHEEDERQAARATARFLGIKNVEIELRPDQLVPLFDELSQYYDEPVADVAAVPIWSICRQARTMGYKVLLTGIGGDEMYYGYDTYNEFSSSIHRFEHLVSAISPGASMVSTCLLENIGHIFLSRALKSSSSMFGKASRRVMMKAASDLCFAADALKKKGATGYARLKDVAVSRFLSVTNAQSDFARYIFDDAQLFQYRNCASEGIDQTYSRLLSTYIPHLGCFHADRGGMGNSIEMRVPFLDQKHVKAVHSLPLKERYSPGEVKPLLKKMIKDLVPRELLQRKKRPFNAPSGTKRVLNRANRDAILHGMLAKNFLKVDPLASNFDNRNYQDFLYRILVFEKWYQLATKPFPQSPTGR